MYQISDQTISAAVTEALRKPTRTFQNRISFGYWTQSGTFASQHTITSLRSLSVTQNGIAAERLSMSGCPTSELRAEFNTTAAQRSYAFKGSLCFVECGVVYSGGQVAYIPIGYFNITEAATENDWQTVTVKGYDFAQSWTEKFSAAGATASALLGDFCNSKHINLLPGTGVSARLSARTVTPEELAILQSLSEREAVAALAGLVGCNARMNAENKLSVRFFDTLPASPDTEQTIPPALQWQGGFKKTSDAVFQLAAVTSNDNENSEDGKSYSSGSGTGIFFSNPIIKRSDINAIPGYAWMKSGNQPRTYQPCEVEWRGDPRVECGDVMQASYKNADHTVLVATVLVARQEIDLTGGFSQRITCPAGDGDIAFDTLDRETRKALNRQYTALEAALAAATQAIKDATGYGYVEINDTVNPSTGRKDGYPDEILIKADVAGSKLIRMNSAGIAFSEDYGETYTTAISFTGIVAAAITSGKITADQITANTITIGKLSQSLQNTISSASSNASAAVSTANAANTAAANASSTANTANSNANSALNRTATMYGTCTTAAGTAEKAVTCTGFALYQGATLSVKFTNANTASAPTLNVNNTGAKAIYVDGTAITKASYWTAGSTHTFVYSGSVWVMTDVFNAARMKELTDYCATNNTTIINGGSIVTGTVTANAIATNAITANKISSGAITSDKISAGAITAEKLAAEALKTINSDYYTVLKSGNLDVCRSSDNILIGTIRSGDLWSSAAANKNFAIAAGYNSDMMTIGKLNSSGSLVQYLNITSAMVNHPIDGATTVDGVFAQKPIYMNQKDILIYGAALKTGDDNDDTSQFAGYWHKRNIYNNGTYGGCGLLKVGVGGVTYSGYKIPTIGLELSNAQEANGNNAFA
ncbi:MAG: hypothetical protein IKD72_09205 [Clostridia bacterium]|nr:hypothetical protein [Clostridia bacterium]